MNNPNDIPVLERPAFFPTQRLTAGDLAAAQTYNRELRWLHNRSLHNWGIAFGLTVSGPSGSQSVTVRVGYAIDCVGRDLVLNQPLELPVPAVASDSKGSPAVYYLTISYAEDADLEAVNRDGECNTSGAVRRVEMPHVRWQDPNDLDPASRYRQGFDVVLGAIRVLNCQLASDISERERRNAIASQQPYVGSGCSQAGNTPWQLWPNYSAPLGVSTNVVTSAAGFRNVPQYQAHVLGDRRYQEAPGSETIVIDGYPQIAQVTASSFELRVLLPTGATVGISQADTFNETDYSGVVSRIASKSKINDKTILAFNPLLQVNHSLFVMMPWQDLGPLQQADFESPLNKIALRNGISRTELLQANNWKMDSLAIVIGQPIALPGQSLKMNPKKVLKPQFMDVLKSTLRWYVVWMGVEG